jgi:hypothetical protein
MRKQKDESYENWSERVRLFEYDIAIKQISAGIDAEIVLESMSKRIQIKLLHFLLNEINEKVKTYYDPITSKKRYEETYLRRAKPADHILDN